MNDEKEVEKIKKECGLSAELVDARVSPSGWDLVPEPPIGDPKNKDFFEADAHKVLDYGKSCYERGSAEWKQKYESLLVLKKSPASKRGLRSWRS